jgi:tyrosyl-tRNA synthetase
MLTFLPIEQIDAMDKWEGSQLNTAKEILAYELTKLVHGEEEATKAQNAARSIFSAAGDSENMPSEEISEDDFTDGKIDILTVLVKAKLVASKSEARRAVEQGGVTVDGEKVSDIKAVFEKDAFADGIVIRRGKKSFKKVIIK